MINKNKAIYKYESALRSGKLIRKPCKICRKRKSEGHHSDYRYPLKVIWLCRKHHRQWHTENGFQKGVTGDTMIRISPEARQILKIKAARLGISIKEFINQLLK